MFFFRRHPVPPASLGCFTEGRMSDAAFGNAESNHPGLLIYRRQGLRPPLLYQCFGAYGVEADLDVADGFWSVRSPSWAKKGPRRELWEEVLPG